jgi:hypothetical protein
MASPLCYLVKEIVSKVMQYWGRLSPPPKALGAGQSGLPHSRTGAKTWLIAVQG